MRETPVQFGSGRSLVGVITEPRASENGYRRPGVIFLNGGVIHRVGPNRLYVRMARQLASRGILSLRFDHSGLGDSKPADDTLPVTERWTAEAGEAITFLTEANNVDRFLLIGICSGAAVGYLAAQGDSRVVGLGLINPPGPPLPRRFVRFFLFHPHRWRRFLVGRARIWAQIQRLLSRAQPASVPEHDILGGIRLLAERGVDLLFVCSEWDAAYDYFHRLHRTKLNEPGLREKVRFAEVPGADHQFRLLGNQDRLVEIITSWVEQRYGDG